MKVKSGRVWLVIGIVCMVLIRGLQYACGVIDKDGFFVKESEKISVWLLSPLLYVAMALFLVISLFIYFGKENKFALRESAILRRPLDLGSILCALGLAANGLILLWNSQWIGALSILAALYFALIGVKMSGARVPIMNLLAVFALAYPCVSVIALFFDTFRDSKASANVLESVAMCAMILFIIVLTKTIMGFGEPMKKAAWCTFVFALYGGLPIIDHIMMKQTELTEILSVTAQSILWLFSVMVYFILGRAEPEVEAEALEIQHEEPTEETAGLNDTEEEQE